MSIWLSFLLVGGLAPEIASDFVAAREHALAKDFNQAAALYQSILDRGGLDADVHYNYGHVLESADKPVEAIVQYELALALNPSDTDAAHNLAQLRERLLKGQLPKATTEAVSIADAVRPLAKDPSLVTTIGWIGALLLFVSCLVQLLVPSQKYLSRGLGGLATLGLIWVALASLPLTETRAVVINEAPLFRGPDDRFANAGKVFPGELVRVLEGAAGFRHVQRADGTLGYIQIKNIRITSYPAP